MTSTSQPVRRSLGDIVKAGFLGAITAAGINVLLYLFGRALGSFPDTALSPSGQPVDAVAAALISILGVAGGTLVYGIISLRLDAAKANRWFLIVAVVVLVLMMPAPFGVAGAPVSQIVIMEVMHLVAGLAAICFLTRWRQPSGR